MSEEVGNRVTFAHDTNGCTLVMCASNALQHMGVKTGTWVTHARSNKNKGRKKKKNSDVEREERLHLPDTGRHSSKEFNGFLLGAP